MALSVEQRRRKAERRRLKRRRRLAARKEAPRPAFTRKAVNVGLADLFLANMAAGAALARILKKKQRQTGSAK